MLFFYFYPEAQKHYKAPRTILAIKVCYIFHIQPLTHNRLDFIKRLWIARALLKLHIKKSVYIFWFRKGLHKELYKNNYYDVVFTEI